MGIGGVPLIMHTTLTGDPYSGANPKGETPDTFEVGEVASQILHSICPRSTASADLGLPPLSWEMHKVCYALAPKSAGSLQEKFRGGLTSPATSSTGLFPCPWDPQAIENLFSHQHRFCRFPFRIEQNARQLHLAGTVVVLSKGDREG